MISLSGQRVLVIGGSSGIGFATAKLACELGAAVTIASRSAEKLAAAAASIGPAVEARALDLTDDAAVEAFFAAVGRFDHVIVTGSQVGMAAVRELPMQTAHAAMDSKFWGFYRVARSADIAPGGSLSVVSGFLASRPAAGRVDRGPHRAVRDHKRVLECLRSGGHLDLHVTGAEVDTDSGVGELVILDGQKFFHDPVGVFIEVVIGSAGNGELAVDADGHRHRCHLPSSPWQFWRRRHRLTLRA